MLPENAKRYYVERYCSVAMRALANRKDLEYRQQTTYIDGIAVHFSVPYLHVDAVTDLQDHNRGCVDSIALRIKHSDLVLHKQLSPQKILAKIIFDTLEQLRCETLLDSHYSGVRKNIDITFNEWCRKSRGNGFTENEIGLLVYTVTQIVRGHLINAIQDEEVEGLIESMRFRLGPVIGNDLVALKKNTHDQYAYAQAALNIAQAVEEIVSCLDDDLSDQRLTALRGKNLLPPLNIEDTKDNQNHDKQTLLNSARGFIDYHVFCTEFDKQCCADTLYRLEQLKTLRQALDKAIVSKAMSIPRLALRMRKVFATLQNRDWKGQREEGYLDGRRLSQLVVRKNDNRIFKQEKQELLCDTALTFLIDNSGSMKSQYQSVAMLIDVFSRALEIAGVNTEVLGFTTNGWAGGRAIKAWQQQNCPPDPGRLNDRLHIIYKSFADSCRQSRLRLAAMMSSLHFKEGLDGEALEWAVERLNRTAESRKCLIMISDGAPMDTATSRYNDDNFLVRHLQSTIKKIEHSTTIELKAISIELDIRDLFQSSISLDLTGSLDNSAFSVIETLFSKSGLQRPIH